MNQRSETEYWSVDRVERFISDVPPELGAYYPPGDALRDGWEWLPGNARSSLTGVYLLAGVNLQLALVPPFAPAPPLTDWKSGMLRALREPRLIGVFLLRLGYYAAGAVDNDSVIAAKSGSRYVHGRHRAGGQSQRRWERNREQWIEILFDRACAAWQDTCGDLARDLDHLALGGDRIVLARFLKRCDALGRLQELEIARRVPVDRPTAASIDDARRSIWSSTVYRPRPQPEP
ncbi:MAG: hypothetical protein HY678_12155, partial [Chloroflexi bacterium]|nr:hypothetical protein [Chloroflexota bacterium]